MAVQPREHDSSSTAQGPVKLQCNTRNRARRRPATAPSSTSPSFMLPLSLHHQPKAESKTTHYNPSPIGTTLSRVFSRLLNRGTNAKKSKDIIPAVPNQSDDTTVSTSRKRLLRHPSRRLPPVSTPSRMSSSQHAIPSTAIFLMPRPSSMEDMTPKSPTINSPFSPAISVGDDTEEGSDGPSADHRKRVQLQMARLAKLKRHLGEEVPPEMVLSPTPHADTTEFRSLSLTERLSNPKRGHQRPRSLDPTARVRSAPAPPSLRLRKGRSLHGKESGFELQAHSSRTVEVVNQEVSFELHLPRPEVDLPEPREPIVRAALRGSDVGNHSSMSTPHGVQHPPHPPNFIMSLSPPSEQLRPYENAAHLGIDNPLNGERTGTKLARSVGMKYPNAEDIGPRSPTAQSLHLMGDDIHPSPSAQTTSFSELEVDVQISRKTRFWQMKVGKEVVQSVHPDDVTKQLRAMKAST